MTTHETAVLKWLGQEVEAQGKTFKRLWGSINTICNIVKKRAHDNLGAFLPCDLSMIPVNSKSF